MLSKRQRRARLHELAHQTHERREAVALERKTGGRIAVQEDHVAVHWERVAGVRESIALTHFNELHRARKSPPRRFR